jgi:endonuclease YncB( thermonuclease family)
MSRSLASSVFALAFAASASAFAADCPLSASATGRVAAVTSGDSFVLDSGLPVRLASVAVPESADGTMAAAALSALVAGRAVEIRAASPGPDRYGRTLAQVFIAGEPETWVQAALIEGGLLEVRTAPDDASCARALLALEAAAREARTGVWADGALAAFRAGDTTLAGRRGTYAAVEGRIVSTGRTERTVFLNFGYDWSTDFTVTMSAADAAAFDFSGIGVEGLPGRLVRVRGWLEERDGATIRIDHAEQIEILDVGG